MKSNLKLWIKSAGIRAIKTFAQTAAAGLSVAAAAGKIDWSAVAATVVTAIVAAVYSLLTSVAGLPEVPEENAPNKDC